MKIKICGITNLEDALLAKKLGADMLGFVFAKSPRKVTEQKAQSILKKLPKSMELHGVTTKVLRFPSFCATSRRSPGTSGLRRIKKCAVFVNEKEETVRKIQKRLRFDYLQFHGDESPEYCNSFKGIAKIIKAFRLKDLESIRGALDYDVDIYMFDTFVKRKYGGTGKLINMNLAKKLSSLIKKPIMISGGLNCKNVARVIRKLKPYAVDVSSGVEKYPGKKDIRLLREFIERVKKLKKSVTRNLVTGNS